MVIDGRSTIVVVRTSECIEAVAISLVSVPTPTRLSLTLFAAMAMSGCYDRGLGERCQEETECETGLRCLTPTTGGDGVCTVGCEDGVCSTGACLTTSQGQLCAMECRTSDDCEGDLSCLQSANGRQGCWADDGELMPRIEDVAGIPCSNDGSCPGGFSCVSQGSARMCAAPCVDEPCAAGLCTETDSGAHCLKRCVHQGDCVGALACRFTPYRDAVCWADDSHLEPIPNGVVVGRVELRDDSNADGRLNPGETACLRVFAWNTTSAVAESVRARLRTNHVGIITSGGAESSRFASCAGVSAVDEQNLAAGEIGEQPLLATTVRLDSNIALEPVNFEVTFEADGGPTWSDSFTVSVSATGAVLEVARVEVRADSNEDGALNPGEDACLRVYAENVGTSKVIDLVASIRADNANLLVSAGARSSRFSSCDGVSAVDDQSIEPGGVGDRPLLATSLVLDPLAPTAPLTFDIAFEDAHGNRWTDSFSLDVDPTRAAVRIGRVEMRADSNEDGALNPGEEACVRVYAHNDGSSQANDVSAMVRARGPHVVVASGARSSRFSSCDGVSALDEQTLPEGATGDGPLLAMSFVVDQAAPVSPISFEVEFEDGHGNRWSDTFSIPVVRSGATIGVHRADLRADSDGDGQLSPGETACVRVYARNTGVSQANDVSASVRIATPDIQIERGQRSSRFDSCDGISATDTVTLGPGRPSDRPVLATTFSIDPQARPGTARFDVTFNDVHGNQWSDDFSLEVRP